MREIIAGVIVFVLFIGGANAARPSVPPGCLKNPTKSGCAKYIKPVITPVVTPSTGDVNVPIAAAVSRAIANLTPTTDGVTAPRGRISVTATVIAVRTAHNAGQVGGVRATYMQLWKRSLSSRPIGYGITTCSSIGSGGFLGRTTAEECHTYFAMPKGKITGAGVSYSRRNYWLVIIGGTGIYAHGAGWVHYDHGRLTITFQ